MNNTSLLKLATALVAFSISAHAVEIFSVASSTNLSPTTSAANFTGGEYDIYGTTDTGNGSGWGSGVTTNFNGATPWSTTNNDTGDVTNYTSVVNPGDQKTAGANTTTYFGPKFYAGLNRDDYKGSGGVIHSNGNGFRIRVNSVSQSDIDTNDGNGINFKAVFMFDADTSSLTEGDGFIFGESDTLVAKLAVPNNLGTGSGEPADSNNRASLATYRAMVKANGEYYAGSLYTVDLAALTGATSSTFDVTETGATATWTLMDNMESQNNSLQRATNAEGVATHPKNLTVDGTTTVAGSTLTNITQVGFLLETTAEINDGGYNWGVRSFSANATPASAPEPAPDLIPWSENFDTAVPLNTSTSGLGAGDWYVSGAGIPSTRPNSSIVLNDAADQVILTTAKLLVDENGNDVVANQQGTQGAVQLGAFGQGTTEGRRVAPVDYEAKYVFDLISFRTGQADLTVRSRGLDGYVHLNLSPAGRVKFTHWHSNFQHSTFNNFNGPSEFRSVGTPEENSSNNGIRITSGGTFDGSGGVTVVIAPPLTAGGVQATANAVMNVDNTEVVSIEMTEVGSGYTDEPSVTFNGGGVTVQPEFTFNFQTDNSSQLAPGVTGDNGSNSTNNKIVELGDVFVDGDTLTLVQSYDSATDTITYYYGLNDDPVTNVIMTLDPAINSAGGYGFFNVITGNRWNNPQNKDAVYLRYQQWGTGTAQIGFNSYALEFTDKDSDGVINRLDWAPDDATETKDTDGDGVGDNGDAHPGYNDGTFSTYLGTWLTDNNYIVDDGTSGGISQEAYDAVVAERDALPTQAAYDAVVAERDALPTAAEIQSTFLDARLGSVGVSVSGGEATISLQVEQSDDDMTTWTAPSEGAADVVIPVSGDATFFRVRAQ
jgi:hypothetical protein